MRRRKRLILAEFVVTVWKDRVDWGGVETLIWRMRHTKPSKGFLPEVRPARRARQPAR